jgi:hypothetical protein
MAINSDKMYDCTRPTRNQALAGQPNARTRIPPRIVPPVADINFWGSFAGALPAQINAKKIEYPLLSGWSTSQRECKQTGISPRIKCTIARDMHVTDYENPNIANITDPRFSGFGLNERSYIDPELGQVRFFYDDINAVRMPNYLTRNKLDSCLTIGDSYGNVDSGNLSLHEARRGAETSWTENSLQFRESLMTSLLRKKNEEQAQKRLAPKHTLF